MNIGIFVISLDPFGTAQAQRRFQTAVFHGLASLTSNNYHYFVLSYKIPPEFKNSDNFTYLAIEQNPRGARIRNALRTRLSRAISFLLRLTALQNKRTDDWLRRLGNIEPKYYKQLRRLNIRILWNMNQHELKTELPYIRTIWDVNQRIYSAFPEFSYTWFGFDGLDRGLAYSLARASYVIVGTAQGKQQLVTMYGVDPSKVHIIPFPAPHLLEEKSVAKARAQIERACSYILYPARLYPHKNHIVILEAMRILRASRNVRLKAIFCGADGGNQTHILKHAERLGIRDDVEYVGLISEERLGEYYKGALALVYSSAVGPDNLPPLEAMAIGCPVIAGEVCGAREQYGDAVLYFDPMKEEELAERIYDLYQSETLRGNLIGRGRARARSWTADDYARKVVSIFDQFSLIARNWERCDSAFT
jgi:glycosyltransferase involved in cell wall biosynthesis